MTAACACDCHTQLAIALDTLTALLARDVEADR